MTTMGAGRLAAMLLVATMGAGCRTVPATPADRPAPTTGTTGTTGTTATGAAARAETPSPDVRFVQQMIPHHAQALVMAALVPTRTSREDLRLLAERIMVSQQDEIAQMRRWLEKRGHPVPAAAATMGHVAHGQQPRATDATDTTDAASAHAHAGMPGMPGMPGMLGREELERLGAARGAAFDRLFLELMIRHHEGALTMVAELFGSPGAAQDTELHGIASEVESDQRMEIVRMRRMLGAASSP